MAYHFICNMFFFCPCCRYVDTHADITKAIRLVLDSKTDYPSACNAAETILVHTDLVATGHAADIVRALQQAKVTVHVGPRLAPQFPHLPVAMSLHHEYSALEVTMEVVDDVGAAIVHINRYGSGHTDVIVTEAAATAARFLRGVDSACVFHNASTRFADGFRFGLGAEVGISTGVCPWVFFFFFFHI